MKKLLTIYIPSYNRASSLLKQLEAIGVSEKIDVVVNDNASTEGKYKDIEQYCLKHNYIYNKNYFNIGADANIFNGFMHFYRSEYLWILSDDDILRTEALLEVLILLENNHVDILFFTHSLIEKLEIHRWTQKDFYEQNIKTADGAGLISNVIYKSDFIRESIPIGFQNIHTCFAHLAILIHSLKNKVAVVGRVGAYHFFLPETALNPSDTHGYDRSFFGFVLLGEQFESDIKLKFINEWSNFWNLRYWYPKQKMGKPNSIFAKCYINENKNFWNFFMMKLLFWRFLSPMFLFAKKVLTRESKNALLQFFKI